MMELKVVFPVAEDGEGFGFGVGLGFGIVGECGGLVLGGGCFFGVQS